MGDTEILKQALRGGKVKPIVKRADSRHWNKTKENRFLDCLAATCNVAASLREVGMSDTTVYRHRKRSAHFRAGCPRGRPPA